MEVEEIVHQIYKNRHPEEVFFRELVSKFEIKLSDRYPNTVFYMIEDNIYMEREKDLNDMWIRYEDFWLVFENKFNFIGDEIPNLISKLIEKYLNISNTLPYTGLENLIEMTEENLLIEKLISS
jgi:hypothetical protein